MELGLLLAARNTNDTTYLIIKSGSQWLMQKMQYLYIREAAKKLNDRFSQFSNFADTAFSSFTAEYYDNIHTTIR